MNNRNESSSTPPSPAATAPRPRASRAFPWKPILGVIAGLIACVWIGRTLVHAYHYEETDDAYVTGHLYQISPQVGGQVQAVPVNDNQSVKAGDVLVKLDPLEFKLAEQKARDQLVATEAQEAQVRAAIPQADTGIAEAEARVAQAKAQLGETESQLALAKLNLTRSEQLFATGGIIAQSELDTTRTAYRSAEATHTASEANVTAAAAAVDSARAARTALDSQVRAAVASVAVSRSILADAGRMLAYTTLTAPADGRVGNKLVETGNHVALGQTLLIVASNDSWIVANFKETQLTLMRPGQPVEVTVDVLPGLKLHGTVDSLAPASGSQFALLPPDNATGNFNKVVQRVPVKITLDAESLAAAGAHLRLGLSVIVHVRVR